MISIHHANKYNTIVNKINEAGLEDQINSLNESKKAFNFKNFLNSFNHKSEDNSISNFSNKLIESSLVLIHFDSLPSSLHSK